MSMIMGFIAGVIVGAFGLFAVSAIMMHHDMKHEINDVHEEDNE